MRIRLIVISLVLFSVTVFAQRTRLRPGTNVFSPQQDVEMGREVAKEAEQEIVLIRNGDANAYISALGEQILAKAPNENKFPFTFKIVDDRSINAFALPGGPVYVHRGAIEAADNEAQLAGVIGHEIAHIILRHGTNQVTKAQFAQAPLAILGGVLGNSSMGQIITQIGGFAAGSILLRYSRDAETQSDLMGTQLLYDLRYDPRAMAQFFDKLAKEHKGSRTEEFFSNHPIPENRINNVNEEIRKLGGLPSDPRLDSSDFQGVRKFMLSLPEPPKPTPRPGGTTSDRPAAPPLPSTRVVNFESGGVRLQHPDNWKPVVQGTHVLLSPERGTDASGNLAYGMIIDVFQAQGARDINEATAQLLESLRRGNPAMKVVRTRVQTRVNGQPALLSEVSNESPAGGQETDIVITVRRGNGDLLYFIQVAPAKDFSQYQTAFRNMMNSVRLQ
jgi:Zn-dependent protease with chaperone function